MPNGCSKEKTKLLMMLTAMLRQYLFCNEIPLNYD